MFKKLKAWFRPTISSAPKVKPASSGTVSQLIEVRALRERKLPKRGKK